MDLKLSLATFLLLLFISCVSTSANKQVDEGVVGGIIYESKEIGWSIKIPDGWKIISKDSIEAIDERGKSAIENSTGQNIDVKGLKHLISFQKDRFNLFDSTIEPFIELYPGEYQDNNSALNKIVFDTFKNQGIKADTSSGTELIQGMKFNKFFTTIYGPDDNVILNQILYSCLINDYDFGVNINYNNEKDKEIMLQAFLESEFIDK